MSSSYVACVSCGEQSSGCGLPVGNDGEIVGVSYRKEWAGAPSCASCSAIHASIRLPSDPSAETALVHAVLDAHLSATRELRAKLAKARGDLQLVSRLCDETLDEINHEPHELTEYAELQMEPIPLDRLPRPAVYKKGTRVLVDGFAFVRAGTTGFETWERDPLRVVP